MVFVDLARSNKRFIKYKMLQGYDRNLVLLNFIRNLWHEPFMGYARKFFETLKKAEHKDPLEKLTWANIKACPYCVYPPGHSNANSPDRLKIKKKKDLLRMKRGCSQFLISFG